MALNNPCICFNLMTLSWDTSSIRTPFNDIQETNKHIITDHKNDLDQILLYGNECCRYDTNKIILLSTISFV